MRKFAIPMLIGLILTMFAFTGCDRPILADEDTWYEVNTNLYNTDVLVYAYYSRSTNQFGNQTVEPGLTFIIAPKTHITTGITAKYYVLKTFAKDTVIVDENDEDANKGLVANGTSLDIIYTACRAKGISFKAKTIPEPLSSNEWAENFDEIKKNFKVDTLSWKSLVKELVNTIL